MESIILQKDSWYIILCLIAGVLYAGALYYKQKNLQDKSIYLVIFLFILRFLSVSLISFLLLSPLYKSINEHKKKPVLIVAQDYSSSITNSYPKSELDKINSNIKSLKEKLKSKFDVQEYSIGGDIQPGLSDTFNLKRTNISSLIDYLNETYDQNEVADIILSSDGIYNEGENPIYTKLKLNAPVYSIALGDTTVRKDLFVNSVFYNDYMFLGDKTAIEIDVQAKNLKKVNSSLKLWEISPNNKLISQKNIKIDNDDFFNSNIIEINPNKEGINHYRVELTPVEGEITVKNNTKDIYIEVVDSKLYIAILANNPHPDISAIKDNLSQKKNYRVDVLFDTKSVNPKKYDLLIYFNLPSKRNNISSIRNIAADSKIPELFIVGTKTDLVQFNESQNLLKIKDNSQNLNNSQAILNEDFELFIIDNLKDSKIENFPPLVVPFGDYIVSPESRILLYQKINNIATKYPLILLSSNSNDRTGVIVGNNLFKWRLYESLQNKENTVLKNMLSQIVQFLTVKKDKSQWRVKSSKKIYFETEPISFYAELFNDNYETVNSPEAYLKIINNKGQEFDYVFSREGTHYKVAVERFPVGDYTFVAKVKLGEKSFSKKSKFKVIKQELEKFDLVAHHDILNIISKNTGGEMFFPGEIDKLTDKLIKSDQKPVILYSEKTNMLLDYKWIFALILFLLSLEWFIRRYNGSF